jgi:prephenate dehydrogenase
VAIAVLGLGLIGGSLLKRLPDTAIGYDLDPATRRAARDAGFDIADTVQQAVKNADITIAAVPLPALPELLAEVGAHAKPNSLLTDVTSVKSPIYQWVRGPVRFVGGHPMAGTEHSGFAAADRDLFTNANWALCLEDDTAIEDWLLIAELVTESGAKVVPTTAVEHDAAVARISHLPHVVAAMLTNLADDPLAKTLAAGSFRDGTRVAATRPELSTAMCQANEAALDQALEQAVRALQKARSPRRLKNQFATAYEIRRNWPATETAAVDITATKAELLALGRSGGWLESINPLQARQPS